MIWRTKYHHNNERYTMKSVVFDNINLCEFGPLSDTRPYINAFKTMFWIWTHLINNKNRSSLRCQNTSIPCLTMVQSDFTLGKEAESHLWKKTCLHRCCRPQTTTCHCHLYPWKQCHSCCYRCHSHLHLSPVITSSYLFLNLVFFMAKRWWSTFKSSLWANVGRGAKDTEDHITAIYKIPSLTVYSFNHSNSSHAI